MMMNYDICLKYDDDDDDGNICLKHDDDDDDRTHDMERTQSLCECEYLNASTSAVITEHSPHCFTEIIIGHPHKINPFKKKKKKKI